MAACIGLFLTHSTSPMWVSWKVFPIIKEAWLMEAPFVGAQSIYSCDSREREIGEPPMGFSLSRLEGYMALLLTLNWSEQVKQLHHVLSLMGPEWEESWMLVNTHNVIHVGQDQEFVFLLY